MADKKISQLTGATTPLAGTEELPLVQSSTTKKATANAITNRAIAPTSVAIGTALDGTLQSIGLAGATDGTTYGLNKWTPSTAEPTTYDLKLTTRFAGAGATAGWQYDFVTRDFYTGSKTYLRFLGGNTVLPDGNLVVGTAGRGIDFSANAHAPGMTSELLNWYEEGTWTPTDASGAGLTFTAIRPRYTRIGRVVNIQVGLLYPSTASTAIAKIGGLPFTSNADSDSIMTCLNSTALYAVGSVEPSTSIIFPKEMGTTNGFTNARLTGAYIGFTGQYFV